jgi:hypothetical protein
LASVDKPSLVMLFFMNSSDVEVSMLQN